jgi:hypothetical protein
MKIKLAALTVLVLTSAGLRAEDKVPPPPPAEGAKPAAAAPAFRGKGKGAEGRQLPMKGEMFKRLDTNGDGKVTKEEFSAHEKQQSEQRFSRIDTNKDGSIEKSEAEEAAKKMRERVQEGGGKLRERLKGKTGEGTLRKRPDGAEKKPTA